MFRFLSAVADNHAGSEILVGLAVTVLFNGFLEEVDALRL